MPYITYNNGLSVTWHDPSENHQLSGDEVIIGDGLEPPAMAQILVAFPNYAAPQPQTTTVTPDVQSILADPANITAIKKALGI